MRGIDEQHPRKPLNWRRAAFALAVTAAAFVVLALHSLVLLLCLCAVILIDAVRSARKSGSWVAVAPSFIAMAFLVFIFSTTAPSPPYDERAARATAASFVTGVIDGGTDAASPFVAEGLMDAWGGFDDVHTSFLGRQPTMVGPFPREVAGTFLVRVEVQASHDLLGIFFVAVGSNGHDYRVIDYSYCAAASGCLEFAGEPGGPPSEV